jgi:hypothetical protein
MASTKNDDRLDSFNEERVEFYRKLYGYDFSGSGIFVKKKRKQLLGLKRKSGGKSVVKEDRTTLANFWYDVRQSVKQAQIDLMLFAEFADKKDIDSAITRASIKQFLGMLLGLPQKTSGEKAKIAELLVELGLGYLQQYSRQVTNSQKRIFEDAIEASQQLTSLMLPENDRIPSYW